MPRWTNAPIGWRELPAQAVGPGDRMAYLDHTSPEVVELLFAVGKIGVVIVPMNWRLAAPELLAVLTDYCAQVLIAGGVLDLATELDERKAPPAELIVVGDTGPHCYENWRSTEARQFHAVVVPR